MTDALLVLQFDDSEQCHAESKKRLTYMLYPLAWCACEVPAVGPKRLDPNHGLNANDQR